MNTLTHSSTKIARANFCGSSLFLVLCFILSVLPTLGRGQTSEFGTAEHKANALIGIFYDLKQTQQRQPVPMSIPSFYKNIENFINQNYDESALDGFFRSARALYTTEIFISHRSASFAPKAFGVDQFVKPTFWLAHYKGQVIPPEAGTYEFVGAADGFIAVAVNGKNILIKHHSNTDKNLRQLGGAVAGPAANGKLRRSLPFESDGKTPLDLDVLLAEAGGEFNAFLLYRRVGANYSKDKGGHEILPVFQLAPHQIPNFTPAQAPLHSPSTQYWQAVP